MNKRLYIVVEGQTEEEFVKDLMAPYFQEREIYVSPAIIRTSAGHKGGFVNYEHLKNDVTRLLRSQGQDILVTTFVDFFRCPKLPGQKEIDSISSHHKKVEAMEKSMASDIDDWRFLPYIQLHEFEALLFASVDGFSVYFDEDISEKIQKVINAFESPEDINSSPETAPSKRLLSIIPDYDKIVYGNIIALEIGLSTILEKCPRFKSWIEGLVKRCRE